MLFSGLSMVASKLGGFSHKKMWCLPVSLLIIKFLFSAALVLSKFL